MHSLKWLFHQEKATLYYSQKVYVYPETALIDRYTGSALDAQ